MRIHHLTVEEALTSLHSGPLGLTEVEARRRLLEFGANSVKTVRGETHLLRFLRGITHFFAIILWIAAMLAFIAEQQSPGEGMATLGFAIIGVILINGGFSYWQEFRAEQAIAALQKILPRQVKVLRDGNVRQIPAADLCPGDMVLLEAGDDIPADCRLVEAFGVRVNNATITGESLPQARGTGPDGEAELMHSRNILLAGTSMMSGQARAVVFATGDHTEFGKIAHLTQTVGELLSPLQVEIMHLSRVIASLAVAIGVVFFFIGQVIGFPFWANFIFAIGLIVANVPEGLLPTVTLALAMGSQRMAKRNALIRHLPAVETLGSTTVICTDKTGTLTQNRMAVKKLFLAGQWHDPTHSEQLSSLASTQRYFFENALLCQDLKATVKNGKRAMLGDPMETALVEMATTALPGCPEYSRVDEIPFDSNRRRLSTLYQSPDGLRLYVKGAPEVLLPLCRQVQMATGVQLLQPELANQFLAAQEVMAAQGLRVLAFAYRDVPQSYDRTHLEEDLILCGLAGLEDPPRPEVPAAMQKCREAGIRVIMVTGDHAHTATALAREIGLLRSPTPVVITGEQLGHLSDIQLQMALDAPEIIFGRVSADQKMRVVSALKRKKEVVAVTGDGVNDAPALRAADIGVAMGLSGTDVAREAADMVLLDDNFASIVAAIEEGRAVFANIRKFLTYILSSNVPELVPYLAFVLLRIPLPLTIIQILAVDLGTDMLPALALGAESPDAQVMQRPPRSRRERLLSAPLLWRAYLFLGTMEAVAAMSAFYFVLHRGRWSFGQQLPRLDPLYLQATTACLSAIIVMQIVNIFLCRDERHSIFSLRLYSNPLILWGVATEITLMLFIVYTRWGQEIFNTAPIGLDVWLFITPFALAMLALEEFRKWLVRSLSVVSDGLPDTRPVRS